MKLDKSIAVFAMVASLMLAVSAAAAQNFNSNPEQVSVDESETLAGFNSSASGQADLIGGNVSNYNISGEQTTDQWAGIYGTATGSLVLGSNETGNSAVFYEWGDASVSNVYAYSKSDGINWGNLTEAGTANVSDAYTEISTSDTDNASETYNVTSVSYSIGDKTLTPPTAETNAASADVYETGVLQDVENESAPVNDSTEQTNDPIFVGKTHEALDAFNGEPADYQMIVPAVVSDDPASSSTTYDLYVELN